LTNIIFLFLVSVLNTHIYLKGGENMSKEALIIIDVQNDFCPGGKLAVSEGDQVIGPLNKFSRFAREQGWQIFATRDWHPGITTHFASCGGLWPEHCVQETEGAKFHHGLKLNGAVILSKGMGDAEDAYSGFEARTQNNESLERLLKEADINRFYIGGLATDYCVKATAIDGASKGFEVRLLSDAAKAVNLQPENGQRAIEEMTKAGVKLTSVSEALRELTKK
jgi:nicotinamidase/pyrazinamidase